MPAEALEMFQIKEYADKPDDYGVLIYSMGSYERMKKWDGQAGYD